MDNFITKNEGLYDGVCLFSVTASKHESVVKWCMTVYRMTIGWNPFKYLSSGKVFKMILKCLFLIFFYVGRFVQLQNPFLLVDLERWILIFFSKNSKAALRQSFYACVYCMQLRFHSITLVWANQRNFFRKRNHLQ